MALTNTIHIRDFIDSIGPDPSRSNAAPGNGFVEIRSFVNVFPEDQFSCSVITVEPLVTRIRAFLSAADRRLFTEDAFFYLDGRFSTSPLPNDSLEIIVHSLSLMRYYHPPYFFSPIRSCPL